MNKFILIVCYLIGLPLFAAESVWQYEYDGNGNQITETIPNGNVITTSYDALNRVEAQSDTLGKLLSNVYDANGNIISSTDALQSTTTYEYDNRNRLIKQTNPEKREWSYAYNISGLPIQVTDPRNYVTQQTYNALDQLIETNYPDGSSTEHTLNAVGNVLTTTDGNGHTTTYTYNALNQRISATDAIGVETFTFDGWDNLLTHTDREGTVDTYTYNGNNQLLSHKRANQTLETRLYDNDNNPRVITDGLGNAVNYVYDHFGTVVKETHNLGVIFSYTYDVSGNLTLTKDSLAQRTSYAYDKRNRQVSETNNAGQTTRMTYNAGNLVEQVISAEGRTQQRGYDTAGRLTRFTNGLGHATAYRYDDADNLTAVVFAKGNTTAYTYDEINRLKQVTYPDSSQHLLSYDNASNLTTYTDAKRQVLKHDYDDINRLIKSDYLNADNITGVSLPLLRRYDYDKKGNVLSVTQTAKDGSEAISQYQYDDFNRLVSVTDANNHRQLYSYNVLGNVVTHTDAQNRISRYAYDTNNRLLGIGHGDGSSTAYRYRNNNQLLSIQHNKIISAYEYDNAQRLSSITQTAGPTELRKESHGYDGDGNLLQKEINKSGNLEVTTNTYDDASYLKSSVRQKGVESTSKTYEYDSNGNRTLLTTQVDSSPATQEELSYNDRDQLIGSKKGSETISYAYDANGNRLNKTHPDYTQSYHWDIHNRLRHLTDTRSSEQAYTYNDKGLRYQVNSDALAYDRGRLSQRYEGAAEAGRYVYGQGMLLLSFYPDDEPTKQLSVLHDSQQSVVDVLENSAIRRGQYTYEPYGERTVVDDDESRIGYTGHQQDSSGLIYMNARYYDPDTATFLSVDPAEGQSLMPLSYHPYQYAYLNPYRYWDPSGKTATGRWLAGFFEGGADRARAKSARLKEAYDNNGTVWGSVKLGFARLGVGFAGGASSGLGTIVSAIDFVPTMVKENLGYGTSGDVKQLDKGFAAGEQSVDNMKALPGQAAEAYGNTSLKTLGGAVSELGSYSRQAVASGNAIYAIGENLPGAVGGGTGVFRIASLGKKSLGGAKKPTTQAVVEGSQCLANKTKTLIASDRKAALVAKEVSDIRRMGVKNHALHQKINKNGFDKSTVGPKVNNWDKQNEHIAGTKAYNNRIATKPDGKKYPSTLTQHPDNLLSEFHSGKANLVKSDATSIVVRFTKPVGNIVDPATGTIIKKTYYGSIKHGKNGKNLHITPTNWNHNQP